MNDADLPVGHGAPLRLRVERQLGYKHAKFVMRVEAVASLAGSAAGRAATGRTSATTTGTPGFDTIPPDRLGPALRRFCPGSRKRGASGAPRDPVAGVSVFQGAQEVRGSQILCWVMRVLARMMSLRMTAVIATLGSFPAARRRW